jgi:flagellar assembly factor FliW
VPLLATKYFGSVSVEAADLYSFPLGIPGFENEKTFVLMQVPGRRPLLLLQSTTKEHVCFPALPILSVDPKYELSVSYEDLQTLELETNHQPVIGQEVMVLALLSMPEENPVTANLMAPVVIHLAKGLGLQAIRCDFHYSHQSPVVNQAREDAC